MEAEPTGVKKEEEGRKLASNLGCRNVEQLSVNQVYEFCTIAGWLWTGEEWSEDPEVEERA